MRNLLKKHQFSGQRRLLALPLCLALFAFGSTAEPVFVSGGRGSVSGVRSRPAPVLPPMTSASSSRFDSPRAAKQPVKRRTGEEAALIMADHRPAVRVLGRVSPAQSGNAQLAHAQGGQGRMSRFNPPLLARSSSTSPTGPVRIVHGANGITVTNE